MINMAKANKKARAERDMQIITQIPLHPKNSEVRKKRSTKRERHRLENKSINEDNWKPHRPDRLFFSGGE